MLAHIHLMKTAGQTISWILRQSFGGNHCDLVGRRHELASAVRWAKRFYPNLRSISGHCVVPYGDLDQAGLAPRFFTFLRDPLDRCVSHYQFSVQKDGCPLTFGRWLEKHQDYQTRKLCGARDAERAIELLEQRVGFVGLVERFDESLVLLRHWCGAPEMDLRYRSRNIAADNRIKRDILSDAATVARIRACHQHDDKLYRHVREVVYPRQISRFGPGLSAALQDLQDSLPGPATLSFQQFVATAKRNVLYKPLTRLVRKAA